MSSFEWNSQIPTTYAVRVSAEVLITGVVVVSGPNSQNEAEQWAIAHVKKGDTDTKWEIEWGSLQDVLICESVRLVPKTP